MLATLRLAVANFGRRLMERFSDDPGYGETLIAAIKREWR